VKIQIEFMPAQNDLTRRRLNYACALFCAVYGHEFLAPGRTGASDIVLSYRPVELMTRAAVRLANLYQARPCREPAPKPVFYQVGDQKTWLVHHAVAPQEPDWLGEIFEWVSCAHEYSVAERDVVGRIPSELNYCAIHDLEPAVPYAAVAMRFLQRAISRILPHCGEAPVSPSPGVRHFVVNTHDVDFLPLNPWASARRLAKNSIISMLRYRHVSSSAGQAWSALSTILGRRDPLDQIESLTRREDEAGISSTFFFLSTRSHVHDANYDLKDPKTNVVIRQVAEGGSEIGIHGSFESLDRPGGLSTECELLRRKGHSISGARQHWLRFTPDRLSEEVERAELSYDCSFGWPNLAGFRGGACFPFPPYDFANERAANFLEFPLVVMDVAMVQQSLKADQWFDVASSVLNASRKFGWGGVSVLWHNTGFDGGQLPASMGDVFWQLVAEGKSCGDRWCSGAEMLNHVCERYANAGLLSSANSPAAVCVS
jgi:hypothetical protein